MVHFDDGAQHAARALNLAPLDAATIEAVQMAAAQASDNLVRAAGPVTMFLAGVLMAQGRAKDLATACELVNQQLRHR